MHKLLCLFVFISVAFCDIVPKNLAGPPTEFPLYTLPTPSQSADVQHSAVFYVQLGSSPSETNVLTQTLPLLVDSQDEFGFTFYSPYEEDITLSMQDPNGHRILLNGASTFFPLGDLHVPGTSYRFRRPEVGTYHLTISTVPLNQTTYSSLTTNTLPDAYIALWNEVALSSYTYLNTYSLLTGSQVGLVTRVFDTSLSNSDMLLGNVPKALQGSIQTAVMSVALPDGTTVDTPMYDNGMNNDEMVNDGVFGALITASVSGQYIFSATVQGTTEDGIGYIRTTQQLVTVVDPTLTLLGSAVGSLDKTQTILVISIAVNAPVNSKYKAYAQVWGTDTNGDSLPIAWISGMAYTHVSSGITYLSLELDLNWVSRVQALAPLSLQSVVIQDPDTFVPIAQADQVPVKTTFSLSAALESIKDSLIGIDGAITPEMLEGRRPDALTAKLNSTELAAAIVLVHGYCSQANPFTKYASDWTNAQFFLASGQNFPHDTFATRVLNWANSFVAFSYVGHSQGGAVGLHIKNYYWSGLDLVSGGRILQSIGTPYQGCSGAGTAADLAKLFGVGCGANQDLTKDGSQLWLRGITTQNRAHVHYYTTTYIQGKTFGDYCNLATNIVLKWPNDGVAEYELSQLPGGQNQGNTEAWCHTADMKYDPQCDDRSRNSIMNSQAARQIKA